MLARERDIFLSRQQRAPSEKIAIFLAFLILLLGYFRQKKY
jgi:hypothetical protein